jgi:hypothetical protein
VRGFRAIEDALAGASGRWGCELRGLHGTPILVGS